MNAIHISASRMLYYIAGIWNAWPTRKYRHHGYKNATNRLILSLIGATTMDYIAADDDLILGLGATAEDALADALNEARDANLIGESEIARENGAITLAAWNARVRAYPCTDLLAQRVRDYGGDLTFGLLPDGRTMGTGDEANA